MFVNYYFYTLSYIDASGDTQVFYVGRTIDPAVRLGDHISRAKRKAQTHKEKFIVQLLANGTQVLMNAVACTRVLSDANDADILSVVAIVEDELIAQYKTLGYILTNTATGVAGFTHGRKSKDVWTPEVLAMLGKKPDATIAKEIGVSVATVCTKRKKLGIPPITQFIWTDEAIALLGTAEDCVVAKRLGTSTSVVNRKRNELGIQRNRDIVWTDDMIALLGTCPDMELGQRFGISDTAVRKKRRTLSIPDYMSTLWTAEIIAMLGTMTDRALANLTGLSHSAICNKRRELAIAAFCRR